MLYQLTLTRFIQIYIAQGIVLAISIAIALSILKRSRKREFVVFSGFYIFTAIALIVNFIYGPLTDPYLVRILNSLTNYLLGFAMIFFAVFSMLLYKGNDKFNIKKQNIFIIIYGLLLSIMFFIPNGVEISPETNWLPIWSWTLFIYVVIVITCMAIGPALFFSIKLYNKFEDEVIKKRWKFFIIGICEYFIVVYGTFLSNTLNIPIFRTAWAIMTLFLAISGTYLVYYGVVLRFRK